MWPILLAFEEAGFNVWPFDPPEMPLVIEIYPSLFYPKGLKSSLEKHLECVKRDRRFDEVQQARASSSDDAFDAAVSALAMWDRREELVGLPTVLEDPDVELEGWIWAPR